MRKKYDSSVIFLYSIGMEDILPSSFRRRIPYSTVSTWRRSDYAEYEGHEFRKVFSNAQTFLELNAKHGRLVRIAKSVFRAWLEISEYLIPLLNNAGHDEIKRSHLLKSIDFLSEALGLDRSLRFFAISRTQYYEWKLQERFECLDSFTQSCVKRHPQQLQLAEITKMKRLLTAPELSHWPVVSVAGDALRKNEVVASLYSWYKYAKLFGFYRKAPKKQQKRTGLIATHPNEYWHVDTTFYELMDGSQVCISFVMDNFSKMILGYHVARRNTFALVCQSLKKAIRTAVLREEFGETILVADGGRENHNRHIDSFIAKLSGYKITKIRALKDIRFSNSPVEAIHRSIKGRYLKNRKFESISALTKYLAWAVNDYNVLRPHYKHRPRTPEEVYFSRKLDFDLRARINAGIKGRIESNRKAKCMQCSKFCGHSECKSG